MAAILLVGRHSSSAVLGTDVLDGSVLATVQNDGVICYDSTTRDRTASFPLGGAAVHTTFDAPAVMHPAAGRMCVALSDDSGSYVASHILQHRQTPQPTGNAGARAFRTWADVSPRMLLPSPALALHVVTGAFGTIPAINSAADAPMVAVLRDGRVGVITVGEPNAGSIGLQFTLTPHPAADTSGSKDAHQAIASASSGSLVAVLSLQRNRSSSSDGGSGNSVGSANGGVLRVFRCSQSGSFTAAALSLLHTVQVSTPSTQSRLQPHISMTSTYVLLQWDDGHVSIVHGINSSAGAPHVNHLLVVEGQASSSAGVNGKPDSSSGRKRKEPAVSATSSLSFYATAADEGQILLLQPPDGSVTNLRHLRYSLLDRQFGCQLSTGLLELASPITDSTLGAGAGRCNSKLQVSSGSGVMEGVLSVNGAVYMLRVPIGRADLLSMIGKLSLSAAAAPVASTKASTSTLAFSPPHTTMSALASSGVPPAVLISPALFNNAGASAPQTQQQQQQQSVSVLPQDDLLLLPVPLRMVTPVEQQPAWRLLQQLRQAPPVASAGSKAVVVLVEQTLQLITAWQQLHPQLHQSQPPSSIPQNSKHVQHGSGGSGLAESATPPPQLLSTAIARAAEAAAWPQLQQLLQLAQLRSADARLPHTHAQLVLQSCPGLLPILAGAQQHALLAHATARLQEVDIAEVMAALALLLAPTTAARLPARQAHYQYLRSQAQDLLAAAEAAPQQARPWAVGVARCAAAAVDGFAYGEVAMHPLLALDLDTVELQGAARGLNNAQVDRLLAYLAKWVDKYTQVLGGGPAAVDLLPPELSMPRFTQCLDWVRVLVDAHLPRLLMSKAPLPHIRQLQTALAVQVSCTEQLSRLLGAADHIRARSPLPQAHVAVAQQYTVTLLDLSVQS